MTTEKEEKKKEKTKSKARESERREKREESNLYWKRYCEIVEVLGREKLEKLTLDLAIEKKKTFGKCQERYRNAEA